VAYKSWQGGGVRQNPVVPLLTTRCRIAEEAEKEFANLGREKGRAGSFLILRDKGGGGWGD
jgi:hypothetical protein